MKMHYSNSGRSNNTRRQLKNSGNNISGFARLKERSKSRQQEIEQAEIILAQRLQRSLDTETLLQFFCQEVAALIPCDSTSFQNSEQNINCNYGKKGRHICQYKLELEGEYLGDLICTRNKPFGDQDLLIIESLTGALVYPLKHSLMYRQAVNLSLQDTLTGVGNRNALEKAVLREQNLVERYDTPFSMLMIDIDFFKKINDRYGHSAGDTTLQSVCQSIKNTIRQSDELFRFGGEEFVVLLNNSDTNSASFMAERIREGIEKIETICDAHTVKVTVSIGVAHFNKKEGMDQLFQSADRALYAAKDSGRNRVSVAA